MLDISKIKRLPLSYTNIGYDVKKPDRIGKNPNAPPEWSLIREIDYQLKTNPKAISAIGDSILILGSKFPGTLGAIVYACGLTVKLYGKITDKRIMTYEELMELKNGKRI